MKDWSSTFVSRMCNLHSQHFHLYYCLRMDQNISQLCFQLNPEHLWPNWQFCLFKPSFGWVGALHGVCSFGQNRFLKNFTTIHFGLSYLFANLQIQIWVELHRWASTAEVERQKFSQNAPFFWWLQIFQKIMEWECNSDILQSNFILWP